ncbi:hypothetical protein VTI74DRAFT_624 [Chaetomium olivicolor]
MKRIVRGRLFDVSINEWLVSSEVTVKRMTWHHVGQDRRRWRQRMTEMRCRSILSTAPRLASPNTVSAGKKMGLTARGNWFLHAKRDPCGPTPPNQQFRWGSSNP